MEDPGCLCSKQPPGKQGAGPGVRGPSWGLPELSALFMWLCLPASRGMLTIQLNFTKDSIQLYRTSWQGGGGEGPFSSVQFRPSVVSNSLRPHGLQLARLPCPSPSPEVCSNSCPSSRWCHLLSYQNSLIDSLGSQQRGQSLQVTASSDPPLTTLVLELDLMPSQARSHQPPQALQSMGSRFLHLLCPPQ